MSWWARLERRGAVLQPEGPFAEAWLAKNRAQLRLELEPITVRAWCRAVVSNEGVDEAEYVFVDHAPPEARNRKFGFAWRPLVAAPAPTGELLVWAREKREADDAKGGGA